MLSESFMGTNRIVTENGPSSAGVVLSNEKSRARFPLRNGLAPSHQNIAVDCDKEDTESNHELIESPTCRKHPIRRSIRKTPQA